MAGFVPLEPGKFGALPVKPKAEKPKAKRKGKSKK